jgi:hypothetical protein
LALVSAGAWTIVACVSDSATTGAEQGTAGGACFSDGTCKTGLTCLSNVCVALDGGSGAPDSSSPSDGSTTADAGDASAGDAATVITFCKSLDAGTYSFCQDWDTPGFTLTTANIENHDFPCTVGLTDGGVSPPSALESSGGATLAGQCDYKIDTGATANARATLDFDLSCSIGGTGKSGAGAALTFGTSSSGITLALSGAQPIGLNTLNVADGSTTIGGSIIADLASGAVCDTNFHHVKIVVVPAGGTALYVDGTQIGSNATLSGFTLGDVKLRLGMMDNEGEESTAVRVDNVVLSVE